MVKLIYVEWYDATAVSDWVQDDDDQIQVDLCQSVGFLVKENDQFISLAAAKSEDKYNAIINIPKPWVERREEFVCP